jgi:hypothetical protein
VDEVYEPCLQRRPLSFCCVRTAECNFVLRQKLQLSTLSLFHPHLSAKQLLQICALRSIATFSGDNDDAICCCRRGLLHNPMEATDSAHLNCLWKAFCAELHLKQQEVALLHWGILFLVGGSIVRRSLANRGLHCQRHRLIFRQVDIAAKALRRLCTTHKAKAAPGIEGLDGTAEGFFLLLCAL